MSFNHDLNERCIITSAEYNKFLKITDNDDTMESYFGFMALKDSNKTEYDQYRITEAEANKLIKDYITERVRDYRINSGTRPIYDRIINRFFTDLIENKDLFNGAIKSLLGELTITEVLSYYPKFIHDKAEAKQLSVHGLKNVGRYFQGMLFYPYGGLDHHLPTECHEPLKGQACGTWNVIQNEIDSDISRLYYCSTFAEIDVYTRADYIRCPLNRQDSSKIELAKYIIDCFNKESDYSLFNDDDEMDKLEVEYIVDCLSDTTIDTIYDAITEALYKHLIEQGKISQDHYKNYDGVIIDNQKANNEQRKNEHAKCIQDTVDFFVSDKSNGLLDDAINNLIIHEPIIQVMLEYLPQSIPDCSEAQQLPIYGAKNVCRYFLSKLKYRVYTEKYRGELSHSLPIKQAESDKGSQPIIDQTTIDSEISLLIYEKSLDKIDEYTDADKTNVAKYIIDRLNNIHDRALFENSDSIDAEDVVEKCLNDETIELLYDKATESLYKHLIEQGYIFKDHYQEYDESNPSYLVWSIARKEFSQMIQQGLV